MNTHGYIKFINKLLFVISLPLTFAGCSSPISQKPLISKDWKTIDLGPFQMTTPSNWNFEDPGEQEDSFVGQITGSKIFLSFDYSGMGYANNLLPTAKEFLERRRWKLECYFCKSGLTYSGHIPDDDAKKTIHTPTKLQKDKFPKADYIADLTLKDSTIYIPIELPAEIKNHNFQVDSDSQYVFKTIWPKVPGKGMTGIYIHGRKTTFNFQMNGENLSLENEQQALAAFKTIRFK